VEGRGFDSWRPRSDATLRDLLLDDGDGWVARRWGPSIKKYFSIYFEIFNAATFLVF
jgi:hypothetical protein